MTELDLITKEDFREFKRELFSMHDKFGIAIAKHEIVIVRMSG